MDGSIQLALPAEALAELEERLLSRVLSALPDREWPAWLSDKTGAEYASVSKSTVKNWRRAGLPHSYIGGLVRIRRADLDGWLESKPRSPGRQTSRGAA